MNTIARTLAALAAATVLTLTATPLASADEAQPLPQCAPPILPPEPCAPPAPVPCSQIELETGEFCPPPPPPCPEPTPDSAADEVAALAEQNAAKARVIADQQARITRQAARIARLKAKLAASR
jgi:hypothetical protein